MTKHLKVISLIVFTLFLACKSEREFIPNRISGLDLTNKIVGSEAEEFVNRLHFGNVAAVKNEIGFYSSPNGTAIIYVSYYEKLTDSAKNLELMVKKISPENSVFMGGESFDLHGVRVYRYSGMGQIHFVFTYQTELYWLSAEARWAEKFLNDYLTLIKD